jgi:hypothetical protein
VKARAAGLLKPDQLITQAKAFRVAKKELGIRSMREGGSVGGKWVWFIDLPHTEQELGGPSPPLAAEARSPSQNRAELSKAELSEVMAWLNSEAKLSDRYWRQFLADCHGFMASPLLDRAVDLGWRADELFGVYRDEFFKFHLDGWGLIGRLQGGYILQLEPSQAVIETAGGHGKRTIVRANLSFAPDITR